MLQLSSRKAAKFWKSLSVPNVAAAITFISGYEEHRFYLIKVFNCGEIGEEIADWPKNEWAVVEVYHCSCFSFFDDEVNPAVTILADNAELQKLLEGWVNHGDSTEVRAAKLFLEVMKGGEYE